MKRLEIIDTNMVISNPKYIEDMNKDSIKVIPMTVLRELSKQKSRGGEIAYKSRNALKGIASSPKGSYILERELTEIYSNTNISPDEQIITVAEYFLHGNTTSAIDPKDYKDVYLSSADVDVKILCDSFNVPINFINKQSAGARELEYKGYKKVCATDESKGDLLAEHYSSLHTDVYSNPFELAQNEYLIIFNPENKKSDYYKLKGKKIKRVNKGKMGDISAKNDEQVIAMDLLMDDSVPIKIITGTFGSGKTFLALNSMIHKIENHKIEKILVARQAEGDSDSKDVGYLKGTFEDKTKEFFKPIFDNIGGGKGGYILDGLLQRGQLELTIPYYMKGRSLVDTVAMVDEAEDLTVKTIKLLGSRIGENSSMIFAGDYKQTEAAYSNNNGLLYLIEKTKDHPLVGFVNLEHDVRSAASKVFADL